MKKQLHDKGMELAPTTPKQFRQTIAQEIEWHAELVQAAGLVPR